MSDLQPAQRRSAISSVEDVLVHYVEYGPVKPGSPYDAAVNALREPPARTLLALHGWMVDHQLLAGPLEPIFADHPGYRRIYPDLPGMGRTRAPERIASSDDMLEIVLGFIERVIGDDPFLLAGMSHGGYLARAVAARLPDQVTGLILICPLGAEVMAPGADVPEHVVLRTSGDLTNILDPALEEQYPGYLVVQTPDTLRRFQEYEGPGFALADMTALDRIQEHFALSAEPEQGNPYPRPTLIVTGRQDSTVGFAAALGWLPHYPRATFAVLDRTGHAIPQEQPELFGAFVRELLVRVDEFELPSRCAS